MDYVAMRNGMVERQVAGRGVQEPALLAALRSVPRELFVPDKLRHLAYEDCALSIEAGQTISQPFIVARMIESARLSKIDRVLEVGAGSGYAAAVLGLVARSVVAVERHADLARRARERLAELGFNNVEIVNADGMLGYPERAPFDAILCAAATPEMPRAWLEQLTPGGRVVLPLGEHDGPQQLVRLTLCKDGRLTEDRLDPVRFVPLVGGGVQL
jgi:protein-L-isoaspartate(D-aspartate) O-methyltransferase